MLVVKKMPSRITLHGEGAGGKMEEIIKFQREIRDAGLEIPGKHIVGASIVHDFFRKSGAFERAEAGDLTGARLIAENAPLPVDIIAIAEKANRDFSRCPFLIARSSGKGKIDKKGTGTYESDLCKNELDALLNSIRKVLMSYFTPEAEKNRKASGSEAGLAIDIEPAVGNHRTELFAPDLSFFGKSFTYYEPGGYVGAVPGFATEYMKDLTLGALFFRDDTDDLGHLMQKKADQGFQIKAFGGHDRAVALNENGESVHVNSGKITSLIELSIPPIFSRMDSLSKNMGGVPIYIEGAIDGVEERSTTYYLNQLSREELAEDSYVPCASGERIIAGGSRVLNGGEAKPKSIVVIDSAKGAQRIWKINDRLEDYLLVLKPEFGQSNVFGDCDFSHLSNAAGICDLNGSGLLKYFAAHLGGEYKMQGKVMAELAFLNPEMLDVEFVAGESGRTLYTVYTPKKNDSLVLRASEKMQSSELELVKGAEEKIAIQIAKPETTKIWEMPGWLRKLLH